MDAVTTRRPRRTRILTALLSLTLLLSGCGGPAPDAGVEDPRPQEERTAEDAPPMETDAARPVVGLTRYQEIRYDDDLGPLDRLDLELPGLSPESRVLYPALAEAMDRAREDDLSASRESYEGRGETIGELLSSGEEEHAYFPWYETTASYVRRADERAVSVLYLWTWYMGGAHGDYGYGARNWDARTGEEIALEDLLSEDGRERFNERVAEELDAAYPDLAPGSMVLDRSLDEYTFTLGPDGVTLWFSPYEIASFADGALSVQLWYGRDAGLFDGAYDASDSAWGVETDLSVPLYWSPDGGETVHTVELWGDGSPDGDWIEEIGIEFDGPVDQLRWEERFGEGTAPGERKVLREKTDAYRIHPCWCHTDEGDGLVIALELVPDADEILLYDLESGSALDPMELTGPRGFWWPEPPEDAEDRSGRDWYRTALTDPNDLPLSTRFYLFGTWDAGGPYVFSPDGLVPQRPYLDIYGHQVLTLKQNLTVHPVSGDDPSHVYEEDVTVPAGTRIRPSATDGEATVIFTVEDPVEGQDSGWSFALTRDEADGWPYTVDGVPEDELFDGILYAG